MRAIGPLLWLLAVTLLDALLQLVEAALLVVPAAWRFQLAMELKQLRIIEAGRVVVPRATCAGFDRLLQVVVVKDVADVAAVTHTFAIGTAGAAG